MIGIIVVWYVERGLILYIIITSEYVDRRVLKC